MLYLFTTIVFFAGLVCGLPPAFAAEMIPAHIPAPASPGPAALVGFLQATVFPVLSALVMGIFTLFMNQLGQKWKIGALADKNNFLFTLAAQGVALAEERAAKFVGSVSELTGSQKLDIAVAHVLNFFPKIDPLRAQDIVHSVLAQIPGAGATKEAVTLLPSSAGYSISGAILGEASIPVPAAP